MSRIGKAPIDVPDKVDVTINGQDVTVKGPLGEMKRTFRPEVKITQEGNVISVSRAEETRQARALHGLSRTLLANMIKGVKEGFNKDLEMIGVGYRAQMQGSKLVMSLGYSHPVEITPPAGITITVENNTKLSVKGFDKQLVGDVAADIRDRRPPEPYKGKGVRYAGEQVRRKAGKSGKK